MAAATRIGAQVVAMFRSPSTAGHHAFEVRVKCCRSPRMLLGAGAQAAAANGQLGLCIAFTAAFYVAPLWAQQPPVAPTTPSEPGIAAKVAPPTQARVEDSPSQSSLLLTFPKSDRAILSLAVAMKTAMSAQPNLRQAKAQVEAAEGKVQQARAGYLPQVTGTATYQRTTGNFVPRPGATANTTIVPAANSKLYNYFNFQIAASQLIYDFGQTSHRWAAAESSALGQRASAAMVRSQTQANVYAAYFQAVAGRALVIVAEEALANQRRHFDQISAIVKVGLRPEIDRTQAQADVATARVAVINARNGYETAKAQLNQAMGSASDTNYDVSAEELPFVRGEDQTIDSLVNSAISRRADVTALEKQRESQLFTLRSLRGSYGPSLSATAAASEGGIQLDNLRYNWNVGLAFNWPILQGGLTRGQIHEAAANLEATDAQLQLIRLQIRTQVTQAKLALGSSQESISSAEEAVLNLRQRLRLAEGRYTAGVGNIIELTDAQVAYFAAQGQLIQAHYNLSLARAQLLLALGLR